MREAVEKAIKELEYTSYVHGKKYADKWEDNRQFHLGVESGLDTAIDKLKEVLSNASSDTGDTSKPE